MDVEELGDWVLAGVPILLGGWVFLMNWLIVFRYFLSRRKSSMYPFAGGLLVGAGLWIAPSESLNSVWWIPLALDPGGGVAVFRLLVEKCGAHTDKQR